MSSTSSVLQILLTGASGYVGQHLLYSMLNDVRIRQQLLAGGRNNEPYDRIHIVAHCHSKAGALRQALAEHVEQKQDASIGGTKVGIVVHPVDLSDREALQDFLKNESAFDVVIHLAAMSSPRLCQEQPDLAKRANVDALDCILSELARTNHPASVVALSTDHVYAGNPSDVPYSIVSPAVPCNVYGQTKLKMEQQCCRPNGKASIVVLRSSIVLGKRAPYLPNETHDTFLHFCASRQGQETSYFTNERRNVISIDNVIQSIMYFASNHPPVSNGDDKARVATFNMGGPASVSRYDMAKAVARHFQFDDADIALVVAETKHADYSNGKLPPAPLDLTMDTQRLQNLLRAEFDDLETIVRKTFDE